MGLKQILEKTIADMGERCVVAPTLGTSYSDGDVLAWMPTGIPLLDYALGGGLAAGRVSELYSRIESEGKSTLAIHCAVACQRMGGLPVWIEAENALDKVRAARMGLDLSKMVIHGPESVEEGFDLLRTIAKNIRHDPELKNQWVLGIWDTIAASPVKAEKESGDPYAEGRSKKPRVIREALRDLTKEFFKSKMHMLFVNQTYVQPTAWGAMFVTEGGGGIRFHSTYRIELHRDDIIQDKEHHQATGIKVGFTVVKNKLALPFRKGFLALNGETGFDEVMSMAWNLFEWKVTDLLKVYPKGWYEPRGGRTHLPRVRWDGIRDAILKHPTILKAWRDWFAQLWPLPAGRAYDEKLGYVVKADEKKEGTVA